MCVANLTSFPLKRKKIHLFNKKLRPPLREVVIASTANHHLPTCNIQASCRTGTHYCRQPFQ